MIKIENGNDVVFTEEVDDKCELCGVVAELRPYGANHERICFDCGMKDMATTERMMGQALDKMLAEVGLDLTEANLIDPLEDLFRKLPPN